MQNHARSFIFLFFSLLSVRCAVAQAGDEQAAGAARHFISTLDDAARQQACFSWQDPERYNFNYVPMARKGLPLAAMNDAQRAAAMALLKSCTSAQGYRKATDIIALEIVLKALEGRAPEDHYRDPGKYFFCIFGEPGLQQPWGWRIDGHHLSLNFTARNHALVAGTPAFFGSNPAIVPDGPQKGKRVLKQEAVLALELLHAFSKEQLDQAVINTKAPSEIITGNKRKAMLLNPPGLPYSKMSSAQQQLFRQLVAVYIDNYSKLMADILLKEVTDAGWDNLHFAWAGGQQWGEGHYYRIQSPAILIEYDNTQNNGNHVHTLLRSLKNDFGEEDLLQAHYRSSHIKN